MAVTAPVWARNRRRAGSQPGERRVCAVSASRGDGAGGSWGDCLGASLTGFGVFSSGHPADRHRLPHPVSQHPETHKSEHPSLPQPSFLCCPLGTHHSPRGGGGTESYSFGMGRRHKQKERASGKQVTRTSPSEGEPWASLHSWGAPWTEVNWATGGLSPQVRWPGPDCQVPPGEAWNYMHALLHPAFPPRPPCHCWAPDCVAS